MENFAIQVPILLILIFLAITFLQSGLDKLFDWQGNLGWLKGHFSKTFMKNMVPPMLGFIMVAEIISGILAVLGFLQILIFGEETLAFCAILLSGISLLMLFFGQRVAKDYPGAFTLTAYFLVVLFGLFFIAV